MNAAYTDLDDPSRQLGLNAMFECEESLKDVEPDKALSQAVPTLILNASVFGKETHRSF